MDGRGRRRAAAVRRVLVVCVGVALVAGCGTTSAPRLSSPVFTTAVLLADPDAAAPGTLSVNVPDDFTIWRRTWGGMCAGGPCGSTLVIDANGRWVLTSQGTSRSGTLPQSTLVALTRATRVTLLDRATGTPDCEADRDGTSLAYTWTVNGVRRSVSSCQHPINHNDSLAVEIERVVHAISP